MIKKVVGVTLALAMLAALPLSAAAQLRSKRETETYTKEHYCLGVQAMNACNWKAAAYHFGTVTRNCPELDYGQDAFYFLGISFFYLEELECANNAFNQYLTCQNNPEYFNEAIEYKFRIGQLLASGYKVRVLGTRSLPKWSEGLGIALEIYDEVIAALPNQEIATQALYLKGNVLWRTKDFRGSVEAYQTLIKRFPKHELAVESYLHINKVYLCQSFYEFQNPDLIALGEINVRRFRKDFPLEERIQEAEKDLLNIKEVYARGLYDIGCFYERKKKPHAAVLYYQNAILQFPETCTASMAEARLRCICPSALDLECYRFAMDELEGLEIDLSETANIDFED
ncbi:MAG: outer membrane protein assembly factor BamD [Chlamydiales bacterium]|nr:outer membrane protein assembly factor BamD [Chlamydiia bacterium]MCP5506924.1 outer membrane protein assembly factor BamD [Chlamydiales bacterium]